MTKDVKRNSDEGINLNTSKGIIGKLDLNSKKADKYKTDKSIIDFDEEPNLRIFESAEMVYPSKALPYAEFIPAGASVELGIVSEAIGKHYHIKFIKIVSSLKLLNELENSKDYHNECCLIQGLIEEVEQIAEKEVYPLESSLLMVLHDLVMNHKTNRFNQAQVNALIECFNAMMNTKLSELDLDNLEDKLLVVNLDWISSFLED